jgi:hypothetical protein
VDRYQGSAQLEWWANRSTCLGTFTVEVDVALGAGSDWDAEAVLTPPLTGDDLEVFEFLMALSPFFTLQFNDGSTFPVGVEVVPGGLRLTPDEGDLPDHWSIHFELG